jgi:hypothetical protein
MTERGWDSYKVRKLTKHDYKLINKAVETIENNKEGFKFRDELKWSIIAILDEIETVEDTLDRIHVSKEFDKMMAKQDRKPIVLVPLEKVKQIAPCTQIEKDSTFKLMS